MLHFNHSPQYSTAHRNRSSRLLVLAVNLCGKGHLNVDHVGCAALVINVEPRVGRWCSRVRQPDTTMGVGAGVDVLSREEDEEKDADPVRKREQTR